MGDPLCSFCERFAVIQYDAGRHRAQRLPVVCTYCRADREYELKQEEEYDESGCCTLCSPDGCQDDYRCCRHD